MNRNWKELLKLSKNAGGAGDMTDEEKERLERILQIPEPVRECIQDKIDVLTSVIMNSERERDTLIDFLNGEERGLEGLEL